MKTPLSDPVNDHKRKGKEARRLIQLRGTPEVTDPISATRARYQDSTHVWPILDPSKWSPCLAITTRIASRQKFKNDPSRLRVASLNHSRATPQGKHRQEGHPPRQIQPISYAHIATYVSLRLRLDTGPMGVTLLIGLPRKTISDFRTDNENANRFKKAITAPK